MAAHKGCAKTGGRLAGVPNKATFEIKALAREHGPAGIARLVQLMHDPSGAVAVAAIKELFDRGYGKAIQPHDGDGQGGPVMIKVVTGVRVDITTSVPSAPRIETRIEADSQENT